MDLLEMKGISKAFPGVQALSDVNFSVKAGTVHALIGENGAGKSTLMKILCGVHKADTGYVKMEGKEIWPESVHEAQQLGISTVFQELNICPHLTVADNIFLSRHETKMGIVKDREMNQKAQALLAELHCNFTPEDVANHLSASQLQLVEIAKALSFDSKIIVFDEPTSSLTTQETEVLFDIIETLRKRGMGIIYISHRLEEIMRICDEVSVLRDGKRIGETMKVADTTVEQMISLMVGRKMGDTYPVEKRKIGDVVFEVSDVSDSELLNVSSLNIRSGEIVGLFGLIGAGRTELGKAIFGARKVTSKHVKLHGQELNIKTPKDAIESGIFYLPEDRKLEGLALNQDIENNINIASLARYTKFGLVHEGKLNENARVYADKLSIKTPSLHQLARNLSGGNQQKICISKSLSTSPQVIILDEPTRGIDVGAKYEIYTILNDLSRNGAAVLFISSDMPELLGMSDRIVTMYEGRITGELLIEEATQEKILGLASGYELQV